MTKLLSARGWVALSAALASATAAAAAAVVQPAEEAVQLPNAADPKPDSAGAQGAAQAVVISLEKRPASSGNSQSQNQQAAAGSGKRRDQAAPFHKPKRN